MKLYKYNLFIKEGEYEEEAENEKEATSLRYSDIQ